MADNKPQLSIGDVSRRCGTTLRALRFYENRGLLRPRKVMGRHRFYSEADVERVAYILRLQRFDFTLREIEAKLDGHPSGNLPRLTVSQIASRLRELKQRREELDRTIAELQAQHSSE